MSSQDEQRAAALDERINKLENEFGQGGDIGRREMIARLKAERADLRPKKLTEYDLRLVQQIDLRGTDGWYLRRGRLYRDYYGRKDRVFWKDGRLHVQWHGHVSADPMAQARSLGSAAPRVLPPRIVRYDSDYASLREWLELVYGPPSLFKLPWENPEVEYRGFVIKVWRENSLGGDELLYFYVMRKRDNRFMEDSYTTGNDTVADYVQLMKERVDAWLALPKRDQMNPDNF